PLPVLNLGLLLIVGSVSRLAASRRRLTSLVLVWSALDLGIAAAVLRPVEFQENRPFVERSPVLAELSSGGPRRGVGIAGDLPMAVGAAPLSNVSVPDVTRLWNPQMELSGVWSGSFSTVPGPWRWWDWGSRLRNVGWWLDDNDTEFMRLCDVRALACALGS